MGSCVLYGVGHKIRIVVQSDVGRESLSTVEARASTLSLDFLYSLDFLVSEVF